MMRRLFFRAKMRRGISNCGKMMRTGTCAGLVGNLQQSIFGLRHRVRRPVAGRFQPYHHTLPDRYPWLFDFAAAALGSCRECRILSFGCSRGEEVLSLRRYFPQASITGIDFDKGNIARCRRRIRDPKINFSVAASTDGEATEQYDAIFCLAVLCHGYLTISGARRCDPLLRFEDFERMVEDFSRCLKPGGLLVLHTTSFRFCDTRIAQSFDTLLEARPEQMAADRHFGRDNLLLEGERYRAVVFRKRSAAS